MPLSYLHRGSNVTLYLILLLLCNSLFHYSHTERNSLDTRTVFVKFLEYVSSGWSVTEGKNFSKCL